MFDTQANLEYEFFIDNKEFECDTKEAEELFLAVVEDYVDPDEYSGSEYSVSQDEPQDISKIYREGNPKAPGHWYQVIEPT